MDAFITLRKDWCRFLPAAVVAGALLLVLAVPVMADELVKAPLSSVFTGFSGKKTVSPGEMSLGYVPGPLNLSFLAGQKFYPVPPVLPARFDLREHGRVSPVQNQGSAGSCWVFATYGSLESTLLPGESWDFSENHAKNTLSRAYAWGYDRDPIQGGDALMTTAYLSRWSGPVSEADDPYVWDSTWSPEVLPVHKHLREMHYLPPRSGPLDNGQIKAAIMASGGVFVAYEHQDGRKGDIGDFYNETYCSYYYNGPFKGNHAVTLVGWDDTFPASHFSLNNTPNPPPGDGAFIVKNSWGPNFAENGFFSISYYDTTLGMMNTSPYFDTNVAVVFLAGPADDYDRVYQHDPFGLINLAGTGSSDTAWGANVFVANATEDISAVGFYALKPWSSYQVEVYIGDPAGPVTPGLFQSIRSAPPEQTTAGTISMPGYYVIPLSHPIRVSEGKRFLVVLRITTPNLGYPLGVEYAMPNYSSHARGSGMGYVSTDGKEWFDIRKALGDPTVDVCLKAFTRDVTLNPEPVITGLSPSQARQGSNGFTLNVYGHGFVKGSQVTWDNVPLATEVISASELAAEVTTEELQTAGGIDIRVVSPPPGGGTSGPYGFTVTPVSPAGPPIAALNATPRSGKVPLTVTFSDESSGCPERWYWMFGDGSTSGEENPVHVYRSPGTYPVTLRVWNQAGNARKVISSYIMVEG